MSLLSSLPNPLFKDLDVVQYQYMDLEVFLRNYNRMNIEPAEAERMLTDINNLCYLVGINPMFVTALVETIYNAFTYIPIQTKEIAAIINRAYMFSIPGIALKCEVTDNDGSIKTLNPENQATYLAYRMLPSASEVFALLQVYNNMF